MRRVFRPLARVRSWAAAVLLVALIGAAPVAAADTWLRVATPDFTVVTSLREKEAAAWAGDFAQYVAAMRDFFHRDKMRLPPLTVVLFAREKEFEKYRPLDGSGQPKQVAGFFLRHESWAVAGLSGVRVRDEVKRTIFHEGVHWFLSTQEQTNPVWLEEGLAEVFSTFNVVKNQAEWGRAIDSHVFLLNHTETLPLEQLLSTAQSDVFGDDELHTNVVYAESWAFVHYMIFGKQQASRLAFLDYADSVHAGVLPAEAFRRAFGKTYVEMDRVLAHYLSMGEYFISRRPLAAVATPKIEVATPVDVADALGRLALAGRQWPLAATHGRAAIAAAPEDSRGHEVLALALKETGDQAGALAEFARAVECGSRDFQPYFELALAAQNAASADGATGTLSSAEARKVSNRYERAINLHPRFLTSYQNLAGVVCLAEPFGPQDRQFLEQGQRLYPGDLMIKIGLAVLTYREGDAVAAHAQLDKVLGTDAGSASARAYAVRVDAVWAQQEIFGRLTKLSEEKKYTEAVALIDERIAGGVPGAMRPQLTMMRRQLQNAALSQSIQQSLQEKRWTDARRFLAEMLASDAPASLKTQARRSLDDLDRQHLGLGAESRK